MSIGGNGFRVELRQTERGWRVEIVDPSGSVVGERACRDANEARVYASTVRQHISEDRGMGFNYQQPGKVKKADLIMFIAALAAVVGLVIWATR